MPLRRSPAPVADPLGTCCRNRPDEAPTELKQEPVSLLYTQLQNFQAQPGLSMTEDDLDFENLFCEEDEEPGLQTGGEHAWGKGGPGARPDCHPEWGALLIAHLTLVVWGCRCRA